MKSKHRGIRITSTGLEMLLSHHRFYCMKCKPGNECEYVRKLMNDIQEEKSRESAQKTLSLS